MDLGIREKVAVVTGGASHIGRAISMTLAKEGSKVAIVDIDEKQAEKTANEIVSQGGDVLVIKADVTDLDQVTDMARKVRDEMGSIDILVNNVGYDELKLFLETDPAFWEKIIRINYISVLNTMHVILPGMVENQSGTVVNISSDAGRVGEFRESVYAGCKAGVIALTKAVAREIGKFHIRLNVVCPGFTIPLTKDEVGQCSLWKESPLTPEMLEKAVKQYALRKLGTAQDVAYAVAFLASDVMAGDITGQVLSVSGGYTMVD